MKESSSDLKEYKDFTANSLTFNVQEKEFANQKINEISHSVQKHACLLNYDKSIYFGGSLARSEPSLRYRNNLPIGLNSDVDLYLVTENNVQLDQEVLSLFAQKVSQENSNIDVAVICVPKLIFASTKLSLYGGPNWSSIYASITKPVMSEIEIKIPPAPKLNFFGVLSVFISRLTHVVLGAHLTSVGNTLVSHETYKNYLILKLIFDTLMLHVDYTRNEMQYGHHLLLEAAKNNIAINELCLYEDVSELIGKLEKFDPSEHLPRFDLIAFLYSNLQQSMNVDINDMDALFTTISEWDPAIDPGLVRIRFTSYLGCFYKLTNASLYKKYFVESLSQCLAMNLIPSGANIDPDNLSSILALFSGLERLRLKQLLTTDNI